MRESEKNRQEALGEDEELHLEKNDTLALILSGFLTIGIPCLLLIGIIVAVVMLLFSGM